MKLSELKAAEYNPREISAEAFEGLKDSIENFGDISGIVFNKKTGNLVSGHQRVKALKDKYGDLDISDNQIKTPEGVFPIRFVNWAQSKERAANIAANAETIQGRWTEGARLIIQEVAITDPSLFKNLNLTALVIPDIDIPHDTIAVQKEESEIPSTSRNVLKWGTKTVFMSDSELEIWTEKFNQYTNMNKNVYGFIKWLLEGAR